MRAECEEAEQDDAGTEPEDYEFFKGVLFLKAENSSSAVFSAFVAKLLKAAQ